jgi:site-specific DNA-adenine methylase
MRTLRIRVTGWDYRRVMDQLGPDDIAYFDPPYLGAAKACGAYDDTTVDYPDLVKRLQHPSFRWMLSEYDNPIYRPLGEPVRVMVRRTMSNSNHTGGIWPVVEECLWSNFTK